MGEDQKHTSLGEKQLARIDLDNTHPLSIDGLIGIISDTHIGSKHAALEELTEYYQYAHHLGVKQVFHCGDIVDGIDIYRGQHYEQDAWGFDGQAEHLSKHYPKIPGMTTYFILGNHDASYWKSQDANIGTRISHDRPDMKYLGMFYARLKDGEFNLDLIHLRKRRAYAISYPIQAFLREILQPNYMIYPQIIGLGHRHQAWIGQVHSIWTLEAGNFQKITPYNLESGMVSSRGGWIIEITRQGRYIEKIRSEFKQTGR